MLRIKHLFPVLFIGLLTSCSYKNASTPEEAVKVFFENLQIKESSKIYKVSTAESHAYVEAINETVTEDVTSVVSDVVCVESNIKSANYDYNCTCKVDGEMVEVSVVDKEGKYYVDLSRNSFSTYSPEVVADTTLVLDSTILSVVDSALGDTHFISIGGN